MSKQVNNLKRHAKWNAIGPLTYSLQSLFFLIIVTRINGVYTAGIFSFVFAFVCLIVCVGNYATRTFHVTETDPHITDQDFLQQRFFTCGLMLAVAVVYGLLQGYDSFSFIVLLLLTLYKVLESFSEVLYAIMQKRDALYRVGSSLFFKGVLGLIAFVIVDLLTQNLIFSLLALVVVLLAFLLCCDLPIILGYHLPKQAVFLDRQWVLLRTGLSPFLFTFLTLYVMNAARYAIDNTLSVESQTIFGIVVMPATVMFLVGQFSVQLFLVPFKEHLQAGDREGLLRLLLKLTVGIIGVGALGTLLAAWIGIPFLSSIYGLELTAYRTHLLLILIGSTLFAVSYLLSAILTAMRKTISQLVVFSLVSGLTLLLSQYLVVQLDLYGAALSYLITMTALLLGYLLLFFLVYRQRKVPA